MILNEYEKCGFEFLLQVFDSCKHLEDLTGLTEIHKEITDLEVSHPRLFVKLIIGTIFFVTGVGS